MIAKENKHHKPDDEMCYGTEMWRQLTRKQARGIN